jgi:hypothetical protein
MDIHHDLMTPREDEMKDGEEMAELVKCATFKTEMEGGRTIRIGAQFWLDTVAERDAATKRAENAECGWHKAETLVKETEYLWRKAEAERDALAGLVTELRGALEKMLNAADKVRHWHNTGDNDEGTIVSSKSFIRLHDTANTCKPALSLPLPAAAAKVADWREKAELLEFYAANPGCVQFIGPEDGGPRRYCYEADGRYHWRSKDGESLDFLSALRAARGQK